MLERVRSSCGKGSVTRTWAVEWSSRCPPFGSTQFSAPLAGGHPVRRRVATTVCSDDSQLPLVFREQQPSSARAMLTFFPNFSLELLDFPPLVLTSTGLSYFTRDCSGGNISAKQMRDLVTSHLLQGIYGTGSRLDLLQAASGRPATNHCDWCTTKTSVRQEFKLP